MRHTFGYKHAEVLAAFVNAAVLISGCTSGNYTIVESIALAVGDDTEALLAFLKEEMERDT